MAVIGASLAVLCAVFTLIYEQFSFGVYSPHMRLMFLCPLAGCALPGLVGLLIPPGLGVCRPAFNLWNSGVAAVCLGLLHRGIVNVSGRYTSDDRIFYILGAALLALAVCVEVVVAIRRRAHSHHIKENSEND